MALHHLFALAQRVHDAHIGIIRQNKANQIIVKAELVAYLDLPKGVYSNWKAGKSRNFCEHLGAISKFLNVSAEYLVTGKDAEKNMENPREIELLNWYRKLNTTPSNGQLGR